MNYAGKQIDAKVFVEELYSPAELKTDPESLTFSTGKLLEVHGFKSVDWNNSAEMGKSFRISFANPGNVMTSSVVEPRGVSKPRTSPRTVMHNRDYLNRVYSERGLNEPFDISPNAVEKAKSVAANAEYLHGYRGDGTNDFGLGNDFVLGEMQRIWAILKMEDDSGEIRYHKIGGIITGFGETVDYGSGNSSFTVECAGFSRLLELTRVHIKPFEGAFFRTQSELFVDRVLRHILPLDAIAQQEGVLGDLGPIGALLYTTWISNAIFSWYGRIARYGQSKVFQSIYEGYGVNTVFYQAPIWLLGAKVPQVPESAREFLRTLREDSPWPQSFDTWIRDTKAMFAQSHEYMSPRSDLFTQRRADEALCDRLFEEGPGPWSNVASLLPRVYYDDLIKHLYGDEAGLQIFEKRFQSSVQAFSFSTMSAADILNKAASAMLGNVREDDAGNLILEIPRYWEAPALERDAAAQVTIIAYADKKVVPESCVTTDYDAPDYIMDGDTMIGYNSSVSESNIVTHVEAPAKWQYVEDGDETMRGLEMTGYSGNNPEDSLRSEEIAATERRYGFRSMTAPTLHSLNLALRNPNGEAVRLKSALDAYADSILDFRNYARKAGTLNPVFAPWLDCCRNLLLMERGELWMITSKVCAYRLGETEADVSMTLSCSSAHLVTERLGYPYLDAINIVEDSQYVQQIRSQIATEQAVVEEPKNTPTLPLPKENMYDDIIQQAATIFDMAPDIIKAIIAHESQFDPKAGGKNEKGELSGATGLMQITQWALLDVIKEFGDTPAGVTKITAAQAKADPYWNIMVGTGYLRICYNKLKGNIYFMLAGYNRGWPTAQKEIIAYVNKNGLKSWPKDPGTSLKICQSMPAEKGNPRGDIYIQRTVRPFNLYASPSRDLFAQGMPSSNSYWMPSEQGRSVDVG